MFENQVIPAQTITSPHFFAPLPMALLGEADARQQQIRLPAPMRLSHGSRSLIVWVYAFERYRDDLGNAQTPGSTTCLVSRRTKSRLNLNEGDEIQIACPRHTDVTVLPGVVGQLPPSNEIYVGSALMEALGKRRSFRRQYALLTFNDICAPVRLRNKGTAEDHIRVGMTGRILFGNIKVRDTVQLTDISFSEQVEPDVRRSPLRSVLGFLDWTCELLLRGAFRAPELALRTVQASIGDDSEAVVRCSPDLYPLLGIEEGDHVIVAWGRRRTVAIALNVIASDEPNEAVLEAQGVERFASPSHVPDHLVLRVASPVRSVLGMPASSVVTVRRRVNPFFLKHLGRATIPMAALAFAAFAVPSHHRFALIAILVFIFVLQMGGLRYTHPPRGRWPR